jgi:two-component sensor histidine kinase
MDDAAKQRREKRTRRAKRPPASDTHWAIMDRVPAALVVLAADDLTVLHANRASHELLGIDPETARGRPVAEVLPGDGQELLDLFRAARDSSTPLSIDHYRFDTESDRVWTVRLTPGSSEPDTENLVLYLADATERMKLIRAAERAADAERRRAEQLDAVFASITDAVVLIDDRGKLRKCNAAAEALFNIDSAPGPRADTPDFALYQVDGAAIPPGSLPLARALRGEVVEREQAVVVRPNRPRRMVSVSAAPVIVDGVVNGAVAVFHDVTGIHRAEQRLARALRTQKKRTLEARTLYDAVSAVSSSLDLNERLKAVAETMATRVGVSRCCIWLLEGSNLRGAAGVGMDAKTLEKLGRAVIANETAGAHVRQAIDAGRAVYVDDIAGLGGKDVLPCCSALRSALIVPLVYGDRVTGLAYLDEPGSKRRFSESDRAIAMAISAQGAIAIENARLYRIEQDRSRTLEFMMAELNHRVKNNLAIVCGLLGLQLTEADPHASREVVLRDCIARIQSISLIHQILHEEDLDAVDMKETARRIAAMVCDTFGSSGQKITWRVRGQRLMLPCKLATSLGLAINELVCNAVKHGFARGADGRITIDFRAAEQIRISVSDDGVGVPPDFDLVAHGHVGSLVVRGLIETELGGEFTLRRNRLGGATALLAFPAAAVRST